MPAAAEKGSSKAPPPPFAPTDLPTIKKRIEGWHPPYASLEEVGADLQAMCAAFMATCAASSKEHKEAKVGG